MPLSEEEKKRLAEINVLLGSGLTQDEEARLLEVEEQLRIDRAPPGVTRVPSARVRGGFTDISNIGKKFIPDVEVEEVSPFGGQGAKFSTGRTVTTEGPEQSLERRRTFIPDEVREDVTELRPRRLGGRPIPTKVGERVVGRPFRPGVETFDELAREKVKSAVSGVDFATGLANLIPGVSIPNIGEQALSEAEDTRGGGQRVVEDLLFGAPLDIAAFGGLSSLGKAGIRQAAKGALRAGVSPGTVRRGLKETTTFPTLRKAGKAVAGTPAFQAARRRLNKPLFEFGQPVDEFGKPIDVGAVVKEAEEHLASARGGQALQQERGATLVDDPAEVLIQESKYQRAKAAVERAETVQGPEPQKIAGRRTTAKFSEKEKSRRIVAELGREFQGEIDDAARGTIKVEQTQRLAENLDIDGLMAREVGSAYNAEEMAALNNAWEGSVSRYQRLAAGGASPAEVRAALQESLEIGEVAIRGASESGRTQRILQEVGKGKTVAEKNMATLIKKFGGKEGFTKEMQARMSHPSFIEDRQLVGQFIRDHTKATFGEKFHEFWINGILSGVTTHVVNNTSNFLFWAMRPALERPISAGFDLLASGGGLIRPRRLFFGESMAELVGLADALKFSPRALWEAARRNATLGVIPRPVKTLLDPKLGAKGPKSLQVAAKAFDTEVPAFGLTKFEGEVGQFGKAAIKGRAGRVARLPGRFLVSADEFYKNINMVTDIHARAYRQASKEVIAGKIKPSQVPNRTAELVKNPPSEMKNLAQAEAIYRTFQKELGVFGKKIQGLRDPEDGIGQMLQYVMPFVRTPINIAKSGLQFSPLNWLRIAARQAGVKKAGAFLKGEALQEEMAKATVGSMLSGGVYLMALEGNVTGSAPRNAKERSLFFEEGKQPYSLRIGNAWVPYGRLEPVGISLGLTADFMQHRKSFNPTDVAMALMISMAKNVTNKTYAQGLAKVVEAGTDPERFSEHLLEGFARSIVPNIITRTSKGIDPTLRDPKSVEESFFATQSGTAKAGAAALESVGLQGRMSEKLREFSELVGPMYTMWGEPISFDTGAIGPDGEITGPLFRSVSPIRITEQGEDSATVEVNRLAKLDTSVIPPSAKLTISKFESRLGERLSREVIDTFSMGKGREMKARVDYLISRPSWQRKTDSQRVVALKAHYNAATTRWGQYLKRRKIPSPYKRRRR